MSHPIAQKIAAHAAAASLAERLVIEDDAPMRLAESFLDAHFRHPLTPLIRRWRDEWWAYGEGWQAMPEENLKARVRDHLDRLDVRRKRGQLIPLRVTTATVNETANALIRSKAAGPLATIVESGDQPVWLDARRTPDARGVIAFRNGLLNVADLLADKVTFEKRSPLWFGSSVSPVDFEAAVPRPDAFLGFLDSILPGDVAGVELLQTWFGYCLTHDTSMQKMLLIVGPPRAGKGAIVRAIRSLLGTENTAGPTLASLSMNFGLWPLLGKSLAVISDARLSGRTDQSIVTERLLTITGEDAVTVDRKNMPAITTAMECRFMLTTNEIPRMVDTSSALANRFLILQLERSFFGAEDRTLDARIAAELPGIALWALEGLRALHARGRFREPETAGEVRQELEELMSPTRAFVQSCCVVEPGSTVTLTDLFAAWNVWCEERQSPAGSAGSFGRDIRAAVPNLKHGQIRDKASDTNARPRVYRGIRLTVATRHAVSLASGGRHGNQAESEGVPSIF